MVRTALWKTNSKNTKIIAARGVKIHALQTRVFLFTQIEEEVQQKPLMYRHCKKKCYSIDPR